MKKLLAVAVSALCMGVYAADSYLYWMVGDSATVTDHQTGGSSAFSIEDGYAAVGVLDATGKQSGYLNLYGDGGSQIGDGNVTIGSASAPYYANLATVGSGYSFYIELFNDQLESVGRSEQILAYNEALAFATTFGVSEPVTTPWAPTSFTTRAVPEPSSALLMLLGCAGLALRRKRLAKA